MYKTLLSDYDARHRELVLENAELRKVLQQIKKDMVSILSSRKPAAKSDKPEHSGVQVVFDHLLHTLYFSFATLPSHFKAADDISSQFQTISLLLCFT